MDGNTSGPVHRERDAFTLEQVNININDKHSAAVCEQCVRKGVVSTGLILTRHKELFVKNVWKNSD